MGPTATGKTGLAVEVARRLKGEIISCDSMQVYRGMDIGTAKATLLEQAQVKHHLIDIVDPLEDFSVARYQQLARETITDLDNRGILPILVGGTGLYYQAVVDDYQFYPMAKRQPVRNYWNEMLSAHGLDFGFEQLKKVDPDYAAVIGERDRKRIVRALEVYELTGVPFSRLKAKNRNNYDLLVIGLNVERQNLYMRIEKRVDDMLDQGLIEEVMGLHKKGCNLSHISMQALGYRQVMHYLQGFITEKMMIEEIKRETRRFAKRQLTWFRRDQRIKWISYDESEDAQDPSENIFEVMAGHKWGL